MTTQTELKRGEIGSLISGTTRKEDLIPAFMLELERLSPKRAAVYEEIYSGCDYASADGNTWISDLFAELEEYAPKYCYFGANPPDGTDYGFWPGTERRQFRFLWADVPSGHPGATGPASRDRVAYLLRAARSRRDTICRIHHSNGQHGYQFGKLQLWEE